MHKDQRTKIHSLSDLGQAIGIPTNNHVPSQNQHNGKGRVVHVFLDTHGRKGKTVTIISGLQHNPKTMEDLARILKHYCGAGGTIKGQTIEIQGDQRTRVTQKLTEREYIVK
jgi:predicted translation initiation factor SUI1